MSLLTFILYACGGSAKSSSGEGNTLAALLKNSTSASTSAAVLSPVGE